MTSPVSGFNDLWVLGSAAVAVLVSISVALKALAQKREISVKLQKSEAHYRSVMACEGLGVILTDAHGTVVEANNTYLKMMGYSRSDLESGLLRPEVITAQTYWPLDAHKQKEFEANGFATAYEKQCIGKEGNLLDVWVSGITGVEGVKGSRVSCLLDVTAQKRLFRLLQESQARFSRLWESNLLGIAFWNIYGKIYEANDAFLTLLGYSQAEVAEGSVNWQALTLPEDQRVHAERVQSAIRGQKIPPYETILIQKNGQHKEALVGYAMLENSKDQGFVLLLDISERKQAEQALLESEQRFRSLADNIPVLIWLTDQNKRNIYANKTYLEFFGPESANFTGLEWVELAHLDDREAVALWAENPVPLREAWNFEIRQKHCNGEYRWLQLAILPRFSPDGAVIGYMGSGVDITERKKANETLEIRIQERTLALQKSSRLLQSIVENVPAMVFLKEAKELRFELFNKAGKSLIGYTDEQLLGKNDYDFFPKEQADFFTAKDRETLNNKQLVSITEEPVLTAMGSTLFLRTKKVPILDEQGEPAYLLGISEDITELKEKQERIEALNQQLQAQILDLNAMNQELESFSYSVSHDLRAPLRTIDGFSQAILEDCGEQLDADGKRYLSRVREGSQQMAQLIDDMLNLSRLTRGSLNKQTVDLSAIVSLIAEDLKRQEPQRQVTFVIESGLYAEADRRLIQAVLENLLGNAWKFTSHHATARIEFGRADFTADEKPVFFVGDDGAGFDMQYADKLFGTFQRLHNATEFSGTGVGLATVQRVIQRHGGKIWAESAVEAGATFYFTL